MEAHSIISRANSTASSTATWRPEPNVSTRGTWGIISICLSTLFICIWKAVHTDVLLHESQSNFVDKLGWLVIGVLTPDLLLYAACCQAYGAYGVHIMARKYLDCPSEPPGWSSYPLHLLKYVRTLLKVRLPCRHASLQLLTTCSNMICSRLESSTYLLEKTEDTER